MAGYGARYGAWCATPPRLTRDYLAGKRAPQIPPLRLFLTVLLVLFLAGGWATRSVDLTPLRTLAAGAGKPVDTDRLLKALPPDVNDKDRREIADSLRGHTTGNLQEAIDSGHINLGLPTKWNAAVTSWLRAHLSLALARPDELIAAIRDRAENFTFLMLPISAFLLAAIFVFRRGFVLFDHLIFSMHSLSFQGLLLSLALLTNQGWMLLAAPMHLFVHLRGVYGTGLPGTLVRMAVLSVLSVLAFTLLVLALIVAGLRVLHA